MHPSLPGMHTLGSPQTTPEQLQLDHLFTSLLDPSAAAPTLLSYLAHYLPTVKNPLNLALLLQHVLHSPVLFGANGAETPAGSTPAPGSTFVPVKTENAFGVCEVMQYAVQKKLEVSQPTLSVELFYQTVVRVLTAETTWKRGVIAAGVLAARGTGEPEPERFQAEVAVFVTEMPVFLNHLRGPMRQEIGSAVLLSTAVAFPYLPHPRAPHLALLLPEAVAFFVREMATFETDAANLAFKNLNRLAHLIEYGFMHAASIQGPLYQLELFSRQLSNHPDSPLLKPLLFAYVIMLQGVCTRGLRLHSSAIKGFGSHLAKVLTCLYELNFVLERVGTGGFDAYTFVYTTALDGLLQLELPKAEILAQEFLRGCHSPDLEISRAKALFFLGYSEHIVTISGARVTTLVILPQAEEYLHDPYRLLVEAAHSVILAHTAALAELHAAAGGGAASSAVVSHDVMALLKVLPYLCVVLEQFPAVLSSVQLNIAAQTLAKTLLGNCDDDYGGALLLLIHKKASETPPGVPLAAPTKVAEESRSLQPPGFSDQPSTFVAEQGSPTVRSALVTALILTVPYIPETMLLHWLNRIWALIGQSNAHERKLLTAAMADCLGTSLDIHRANIAIPWWFASKL